MKNKTLILFLIALLTFGLRTFQMVKETYEWLPYLDKTRENEELEYTFRWRDYNELYKEVIVNEAILGVESGELGSFAHIYNLYTKIYVDKKMDEDYSLKLQKIAEYKKNIQSREILEEIDRLEALYLKD